jgi:hypothetical protein
MDDDRGTVIKFEPALKRKKPTGGPAGKGVNSNLLRTILKTLVVVVVVALGYYALSIR